LRVTRIELAYPAWEAPHPEYPVQFVPTFSLKMKMFTSHINIYSTTQQKVDIGVELQTCQECYVLDAGLRILLKLFQVTFL
jgi:hypothetical protein